MSSFWRSTGRSCGRVFIVPPLAAAAAPRGGASGARPPRLRPSSLFAIGCHDAPRVRSVSITEPAARDGETSESGQERLLVLYRAPASAAFSAGAFRVASARGIGSSARKGLTVLGCALIRRGSFGSLTLWRRRRDARAAARERCTRAHLKGSQFLTMRVRTVPGLGPWPLAGAGVWGLRLR